MIFGFSSMGEPEADWSTLETLALRFGLDFVEVRSLAGTIDLPSLFRKQGDPRPAASPCPVRLVGSSLQLAEAGEADIASFLEYARIGEAWGARYVRVFGGGTWPGDLAPGAWDHAVETVAICRERMQALGLTIGMILETHSGFSSSPRCLELNERLAQPLDILWDSHHTWRLAGEAPEETWRQLGPRIRHVHFKDSITPAAVPQRHDYVLPGQGEFPTRELLALLRRERFAEGLSLEWEKLWHRQLAPLEEALEAFRRVIDQPWRP